MKIFHEKNYTKLLTKMYVNILNNQGESTEKVLEILKSKSRDNSRTPMQWNDEENSGFSTGTPWIPVGKSYKEVNAEKSVKDNNSIFNHYKKLIELRKEYEVISKGNIKMILEDHNKVMAYVRKYEDKELLVLNNFYAETTKVNIASDIVSKFIDSKILISNYVDSEKLSDEITLRPYESIAYYIEK